MEKEKISIIVPIYNVEPFIRRCITSLINQTYKNLEIILIDDESPDNSGKIADAFAKMDKRIRVIHQKNKGLCGARNAGLKVATGKYIGFIDSDDWVLPDMYEYLYKAIKEYDADISACRYFRVKNNQINVKTDGEIRVYNKKEVIYNIVENFDIRTVFWNKLFRRELFKGFSFPEGKVFEGTHTMHTLIDKIDKLVFLPEAKYYYLDNETSIINTKNISNQCDYTLGFIKRYKDLSNTYPGLKQTMMTQVVKSCIELLTALNNSRNVEVKKYNNKYSEIYNFLETNISFIKTIPKINFVTLWKLKTFKKITKTKLLLIAFEKFLSVRFKRIRNTINNKFKKSKVIAQKNNVIMNDLTIEDKEIFKNLHDKELYILDEFARLCKKHNLKFFLYGGTLLGAVRHKGFIPWDDDIDIIMPREDYDKLAIIAPQELSKDFYYQTNKTDEDYDLLFAKIRLNNTFVSEEKFIGKKLHQGIFIDILPLDVFPELSQIQKNKLLERFNVINCACQNNKCFSNKITSKALFKIYKMLPNKTMQRKRDKFITGFSSEKKSSLVCSFGSHYRPISKRVMKKEWFEDSGLTMTFENRELPVPKGWKEYLLHLFGPNYMDLPPENKRINHFNFYDVNFDTKNKK